MEDSLLTEEDIQELQYMSSFCKVRTLEEIEKDLKEDEPNQARRRQVLLDLEEKVPERFKQHKESMWYYMAESLGKKCVIQNDKLKWGRVRFDLVSIQDGSTTIKLDIDPGNISDNGEKFHRRVVLARKLLLKNVC